MGPTNNIRQLREERGVSQGELARRIGATSSTISRLETGERRLSHQYITAISRALGCDPADLISNTSGAHGNREFIPVAGECHAKMWSVQTSNGGTRTIPVTPMGKYEKLSHSAYEAMDDSAKELIGRGGFAITIPFSAVRRNALDGDWIVLHSVEGRMERFVIAPANSDQRGSFATVMGEEIMFDERNKPIGLVVATYCEL